MTRRNRKWIFIDDKFNPKKSIMLYVIKETEQFVWGIVVDDPKEKVIKIAKTMIISSLEEMD